MARISAAGVGWNIAAFGVLGLSGALINVVVGRFYGAEALGVFNQVFALYTLLSQLAVFGIHLSALKYLSEHHDDPAVVTSALRAALMVVILIAGIVTVGSWFLPTLIGVAFDSPQLANSWRYVVPGLLFFSINKVYLSAINALGWVRAFAVGQMLRYVMIAACLVGLALGQLPAPVLPAAIVFSELVLSIGLTWYLRSVLFGSQFDRRRYAEWKRTHLAFGSRGWLSGSITEINQRADILLLGYFMSDHLVGVYSFASTIVDGFVQLGVAVRQVVNPMLARMYAQGKTEELMAMARRLVRRSYLLFGALSLVAVAAYPLATDLLLGNARFQEGQVAFAILMAGFVVRSGYLPLSMLLIQAGRPGTQTIYMVSVVGLKTLLTLVLIPSFGLVGAAAASAAAFTASILMFRWLARRELSLAI